MKADRIMTVEPLGVAETMTVFEDDRVVTVTEADDRPITTEHRLKVTVTEWKATHVGHRDANYRYRLTVQHTTNEGATVEVLGEEWLGTDKTEAIYEAIDALGDPYYVEQVEETADGWYERD